ncbi:ABC transporter substrate-binding protein [Tyzzerella sp. OttesenSCG-928-J15]|nr:ABC transporter substrate-binding protein [Tyzzerella sp. OttesenSCG-928-J15]
MKIGALISGKVLKVTAAMLIMAQLFGGCANSEKQAEGTREENGGNELTISVTSENNFLTEAANLYMEENDGVEVTINIIDIQNNRDKYTQTVSTELMGGKGADIYDAMFLSYFKLADSGMLADLGEYISDELKNGDYYTTLFDSFKYNGKQYALPLNYNFTGYKKNKDVADEYNINIPDGNLKLRDLISLSSQLPDDGSVMLVGEGGGGMNDLILAGDLVAQSFKQFVDMESKKSEFDNDKFYSIINAVNSFVERKQLHSHKAAVNGEIDYTKQVKSLLTPYFLYTPAMCNDGTMDYSGMVHLTNDDGFTTFSSSGFIPVVNNNSPNKELAADFIMFMLSDEMQSSPELLFCPVNKNAVSHVSKYVYEDSKAGGWLPENFTEETLENNIKIFGELTESLNIYAYQERFINSLIYNELDMLFSGSETMEQAAQNLQSSINSYLNE